MNQKNPIFIHLRLHTEFSLVDGIITVPDLMDKATVFSMPAIALTDQGNLYATVKFYQAAIAAGIKPIIGADLWVMPEPGEAFSRLTLLCQTHQGYLNLLKLISKSHLEGQAISDRAAIKKTWLKSCHQGLIALSGAQEGDLGQALLAQDQAKAKTCFEFWHALFPNRFYIEISRVGKLNEENYIRAAASFAETFSIPIVATNDVRFLKQEDYDAHEARVCIQEGVTLNDPNRSRSYTDQQYLRSPEEMERLFADLPQALENSVEIAKRCNLSISLGTPYLPHFEVPVGDTAETYIIKAARQGLNQRLLTITADRKPYDERLQRELDVINSMGFAGYFLIVADFTKWAKENEIPVGPGRGSGPGSLVAYSLNITDLDPLAFELLFERFLNPERVSMPDFDIDFCMEGRDRVIEYVMDKHGHDSVAQIITYGTMAARAVVRDVGRVLALGYGFVDKIAKLIPFELGITLEKALDQEPMLRERFQKEEDVKTLIELALKLEGITRNVGKHAGGIVIAPGKLIDFVPLYCEPNEAAHPVTQFDKDDVESVGLVKFDFLGLKTLTVIDRALRIINRELAEKKQALIDITLIPLQDPPTFNLLKACQSTAVFQLESHGMRDLIKRLQPDCFEDLIALVALFRPGPLQSGMVDDFINRKHGRAKVIYPHPELEPILRPTYGVILYQEQVMQIAQVLAGYTLGAADILRRAMGKKKPEEMHKQREIFCQGAIKRNVNGEVASHIFDLMEKFAGYGFNKSHSASYALIAYQTAWLKTHFPAAFMAAVLSSDMDNTDKILTFLDDCKTLGVTVSPPDINQSDYYFKVLDEKNLRFGLGAIKGAGQTAIENMMAARMKGGDFKNLFDFCGRVDLRKINRRGIEPLIKAGAFDSLKQHRASLMASLNNAFQQAEKTLQNQARGQQDLMGMAFDDHIVSYVETPEWNDETRLQGEKETLGFYLSGHPLNRYLDELSHLTTCSLTTIQSKLNQMATVAGIITKIRTRQTKRGDRIAIFTLEDGRTHLEVVCFAEVYQTYRHLIVNDELIILSGEVSIDEFSGGHRLVCRDMTTIMDARERSGKNLQITLPTLESIQVDQLSMFLAQHPGHCEVVLRYIQNDIQTKVKLGKSWFIKPTDALMSALEQAFEGVTVVMKFS